MNLKLLLIAVISIYATRINAQGPTFKLTGKIVDKESEVPMTGVYISVFDVNKPSEVVTVMTDQNGNFKISNLTLHVNYHLKTTFLGYSTVEIPFTGKNDAENIGTIELSPKAKEIKEVVINGEAAAAVQKGDTTELNAKAFATNPDATAEDLMKKMPGITVDNTGAVKAQGEDVKKVLVDGKVFFGDDPTIALRNLPAEVIDKVQVFDKLSDQAELTGIDDGQSVKTLNIITKQNRRNGTFGKVYAGDTHNGNYMLGGNLNYFNNTRRISIIGLSNNINQQNFSTQDLLGVLGVSNNRLGNGGGSMRQGPGGGGGGGGNFGGGGGALNNFLVGQQNGISTTNSLGLNYSDSWGKKINVSGSFFVNANKNTTDQTSTTQTAISSDSIQYYDQTSDVTAKNYNYRFNFRFEYQIDSLNSLIITPRLNFQNNQTNSSLTSLNNQQIDTTLNSGTTHGYNIANNITFRHRFMKKGRTFSIDLSSSNNQKDSRTEHFSNLLYTQQIPKDSIVNQETPGNTNGYTLGSSIIYTEPVTKSSLIQFAYRNTYTRNNTDKETYNVNTPGIQLRDTALSNVFTSTNTTNQAGISYRIRTPKLNFAIGSDYQWSYLKGNESFPVNYHVNKPMDDLLMNLMLNYKFSPTHNLILRYRESTNLPTIQQLQNVIDNTNPPFFSTGNLNLKQENVHTLLTRYSFAKPEKSTSYFLFLYLNYTRHNIGTSTIIATKDTTINGNFRLNKNDQLTQPVNLDHSWNTRAMFMYSFPINLIKTKVNLLGGGSYLQTPGYINNQINRSNTYNGNIGVVFASNISEKVDFTLSYTANYNVAQNSIQSQNNNNYWSHTYGVKLNLIFWKGIVFQNDFNGQLYRGLPGMYNTNFKLWNMGLAKKFFKNQSGELKASVFDLLNQNKNIARTVGSNGSITDFNTNTLRRYYMLTFTYTLRNFKGQEPAQNPQNQRRWGGDRHEDF